jgi:hypothetical protein
MKEWREISSGFVYDLEQATAIVINWPSAANNGVWLVHLERPSCGDHEYCDTTCMAIPAWEQPAERSAVWVQRTAIVLVCTFLRAEIERNQRLLKELE